MGHSYAFFLNNIRLPFLSFIHPFWQKPLILVGNKIDVAGLESLSPEFKMRFEQLQAEGVEIMSMSTLAELGVDDVKNAVCE